jgi:hypothetical protein
MPKPHFGFREALLLAVVLTIAGAARVGYLLTAASDVQKPAPFQVQDAETEITLVRGGTAGTPPTDRDLLVDNLQQYNWYGTLAPLADREEPTAHISPGYPWLVAILSRWIDHPERTTLTIHWIQCVLGTLTAALYFLFARAAFGSSLVGLLAGLLTAVHPFWIVNVAELQDGTLVCFLLASCLYLGTVAAKRGGTVTSLLFGLALAGLALTRAALLPYAFLASLWFLLRCRTLPRGWLCAILAFLGFANGLTPWLVRNFQVFRDVVPITDSMYLHLWMGNNQLARGGPQDELTLWASLPAERLKVLQAETNQARRYGMLAEDLKAAIQENPRGVVEKRLRSLVCFLFGAAWFKEPFTLVRKHPDADLPPELVEALTLALPVALIVLLVVGLLGWRWSYGWNREANLASLALLWIPLPYLLGHAEHFSGPRLPLDGVLLSYTAFALAWMLPPVARLVFPKRDAEE